MLECIDYINRKFNYLNNNKTTGFIKNNANYVISRYNYVFDKYISNKKIDKPEGNRIHSEHFDYEPYKRK